MFGRRFAALAVALVSGSPASAQTYTWAGAGTIWNSAANWGAPTFPNSPTAVAMFTGNGTFYSVAITSSVSAQSLTFTNSTLSYSLNSNPGVSLSGVTAITVGAGVTSSQTINLANIAAGSLLFPTGNFLDINNNSFAGGTLVIGPSTVIGTPGNGGVYVGGPGTTQISGSFSTVPANAVIGGLHKTGSGTLILSNPGNSYSGGTFVNAGTLLLGSGTAIPTGSNVLVALSGVFDTAGLSNGTSTSSSNAIGTLSLGADSTFRVPTGAGDYWLNNLTMTGGTVDFTGTSNFWLHFTGNGPAIATNASSTTARWIGDGASRMQNNTTGSVNITVASGSTPNGIDLDAGISLSSGGTGAYFEKYGAGTMRLTSLGNTANIVVREGNLRVDNVATDGFGALGTGTIWLDEARLQYGGPTASTNKNFSFVRDGTIQVLNDQANLTINGTLTEINSFQSLSVLGPPVSGALSTLTLTANNTYSGETLVSENAVLAVPTIGFGGVSSPIGTSTNAPGNLQLGSVIPNGPGFDHSRGTLLLTVAGSYFTDRGVTLVGQYESGGGGAIGVRNAGSLLNWNGQITGQSLIKTGDGTLYLSNVTNNYLGGTYIEAGSIIVELSGPVLPANRNVTVFNGATLQVVYANGSNVLNPPGAISLVGGTLLATGSNSTFTFNKIVMTGGTVNSSNSTSFTFNFRNAGAALITNPSITTATWVGSADSLFTNLSNAQLPIIVASGQTANGIDLDIGMRMTTEYPISQQFIKAGTGTMRLTNLQNSADITIGDGALRVDDLSNGSGPLGTGPIKLNGGRIAYGGGANATLSKPFSVDVGGGGIDVLNADTTLTLTSPVTHNGGPFAKGGPGVLVLNNSANLFLAGLTVANGRLEVGSDVLLGAGNVTVQALGTLRYTANTSTARTFTMFNGSIDVPGGVTLTMNGATAGGGFLRGNGTYDLSGGTSLTGATTFSSANLNVAGPASITNFAHNGNLTVASGQSLAMNYATNASAGRMTINGTANVSDFVSNGLINVPTGGMLNNSASPSGIVLGGGSTTFVGTPAVPGGIINVGSQPMLVRGGLLVNNGAIGNSTGTGQVIVDYGGFAKGTGYYDTLPQTINGGKFSPGNSPGRVTVGSVNMTPGGIYDFEINNATGTAGPTGTMNLSGWDLTIVSNQINPNLSNLTVSATSATPFTINLVTLRNPSPPDIPDAMANFNATQPFQWLAFDVNPAGSVVNWDPSAIVVNTSQFMNTFNGTFSLVRDTGNPFQFYISYTPVPEPVFMLTICAGAAGVGMFVRRSRRRSAILKSRTEMIN